MQVPVRLRDLHALQALGQASQVLCELWIVFGPDPDVAVNLANSTACFVGMASVPLPASNMDCSPGCLLAQGLFVIRNVLEGRDNGSAMLRLQLEAKKDGHTSSVPGARSDEQHSAAQPLTPSNPAQECNAAQCPAHDGVQDRHSEVNELPQLSAAEHCEPPLALHLQPVKVTEQSICVHSFRVSIQRLHGLADEQELTSAGMRLPVGRYVRCARLSASRHV